jgi:glycosyltransferase involved in cell wall biosynthesis
MRILRVITRLDVHGGAELSTLIEVEELAARGHQVAVVTVAEATTPAAVGRLDRAGVEHRHLTGGRPQQARALRRMISSWRPQVVHAVIWDAEVVTALASVGSSVPTLVSLVNMQYAPEAVAQAPSPQRLEVLRRVEGALLRHGIDHFHCLTQAGAEHSVEHLGIRPGRITVVPRGRRSEDLTADPAEVALLRAELLGDDEVLLVNVGRHEAQKGQDLLLDAVAEMGSGEGVRLVVAGREGNSTDLLRERIVLRGLQERVRLLGARQDVAALLGAADIVAVTSRWEGLGGSIIETLAAGAPVVAFGVPAVSEVVGDAAVVVEPFDTEAFAGALRSLILDGDRRRKLSVAARDRFVADFEIGAVVDRIEQLYRELARAD